MHRKASTLWMLPLTLILLVGIVLPLGVAMPVAAQEDVEERRAHIRVTISEENVNIDRPFTFEAALYTGTEPGEETSGRLTQWVVDVGNTVNIRLPLHTLEGEALPWDAEDEVYVRVRATDVSWINPYPAFDMVSESFTLEDNLYTVSWVIEHEETTVAADRSQVEIILEYNDFTFDVIGPWEASLYARLPAEPDVCYTVFKDSVGGTATINLPEDVEPGEVMRWNVNNYAHVRTLDGVYPYVELAGSQWLLRQNQRTTVWMRITHTVTDEELPEPSELIGVDDYIVYTVRPGDTLSSISMRAYGTSRRFPGIVAATNELAQTEDGIATITNPNLIRVGWRIVIPDPVSTP
jgi:LysM repeat protein